MSRIRSSNQRVNVAMSQRCGLRNTVFFLSGDRYTGQWYNDRMHGRGTYVWKSSNMTYRGNWVDGQMCGHGVLSATSATTAADGQLSCRYVGQWRHGKRHGHGTNNYENGDSYCGEWARDQRHGHGQIKYADGSVYDGQWSRDLRSGHGKLTMANGDFYEGGWLDDVKHGQGRHMFTSKDVVLESVWSNGVPKAGELSSPYEKLPLNLQNWFRVNRSCSEQISSHRGL